MTGLCYIGRIENVDPIPGADRIDSATVLCGRGGRWRGTVQKGEFANGNKCIVFLPDAIVPKWESLAFMEKHNWRVRMRRFKGVPSEVLIVPVDPILDVNVGDDMTEEFGVTKYEKPIPTNSGDILGNFPSWVPKTDEPRFQAVPEMVRMLIGEPWVATLKYDGTSCTVCKLDDKISVCSRNYEVADGNNIYWKMARKYGLLDKISNGTAIQCEIYGPGVQKNPAGASDARIRVFDVYRREIGYVSHTMLNAYCKAYDLPVVDVVDWGEHFLKSSDELLEMAESALYHNGKAAEGVVIRPTIETETPYGRLSFKVINLKYKD